MGSQSMDMQCWKCGTDLKNVLLPFSRYEECSTCKADLHTCLGCLHYDPSVSDSCREDRADFVLDKDKANFCDFFKANSKAYRKKDDTQAIAARNKLDELFGTETDSSESSTETTSQSEAEKALADLKKLFGDDS